MANFQITTLLFITNALKKDGQSFQDEPLTPKTRDYCRAKIYTSETKTICTHFPNSFPVLYASRYTCP